MEYRTNMTVSIFNYDSLEGYVSSDKLIGTIEEKKELLQKIMDVNPHLHFSWETADDYIGMFKTAAPDNAARMEAHMINILEHVNTCWTFSEAMYYNPYYKFTKEEFDAYSDEMNKLYK